VQACNAECMHLTVTSYTGENKYSATLCKSKREKINYNIWRSILRQCLKIYLDLHLAVAKAEIIA
jgi:hypothetical protein